MKKRSGALLIIGMAAGVLSGLIGVGGGIIIVPALVMLLGFPQQQAQGNSLALLLLPVSLMAVGNYSNRGLVNWSAVAVMALCFIAGGWIGSKLAARLPEKGVKIIFALLMLATALKMLA